MTMQERFDAWLAEKLTVSIEHESHETIALLASAFQEYVPDVHVEYEDCATVEDFILAMETEDWPYIIHSHGGIAACKRRWFENRDSYVMFLSASEFLDGYTVVESDDSIFEVLDLEM